MKYPLAIVGMVAALMTLAACSAPAQDEGSLESRISTLEKKLGSIEANLGKLDVISDQLVKLREETDANRGAAVSDATTPADAADEETADDSATVDFPPSDPTPPAVADGSNPADDPVLVGRVKTLEATIAAIEQQLKKLDDIAEQVILLSKEDRAATQRERSDLVELSGRASSAEPKSSAEAEEGTVIVNNWTGVTHWVAINGKAYRVAPGRSEIKTPYGVFTTQLVEYEAQRQWDASQWKNVGGKYQVTLDLKN